MEIVLELQELHPLQEKVKSEAARYNVLACGRRWGKTTLDIDLMAETTLAGYPVAYFAPTYKMLGEVWREASSLFRPLAQRVSIQDHRIDFMTGGSIDMWSLDSPDGPRGRKYKRALIDEAAMVVNLQDAWEKVIRPTLADLEGDAWFNSTPKGRRFFYELFMRGQNNMPGWKSWRFPTSENPYIKAEEIEAMRNEMPHNVFQQEIMAQFIEDGGGVFRHVRECATAVQQDRAIDGHVYAFGVDWARTNDYTVVMVYDVTLQQQVAVDRFSQIDYHTQVNRLTALYERFRPTTIVSEGNSMGGPLTEDLQRLGLPVVRFDTTAQTKAVIIQALELAFEQERLHILPDEVVIDELQSYEQERTATGIKYGAPAGQHDDCVMSLALALYASEHSRIQVWI